MVRAQPGVDSLLLPHIPESIDIGVVHPKNWVIRREGATHVPADKAVACVVRLGQLTNPLLDDKPEDPQRMRALQRLIHIDEGSQPRP